MILWALEAPLVPPLVEASLFHVLFLQRFRLWGTQGTDSYPEYNFCPKGEKPHDCSNGDYAQRGSGPTVSWAKLWRVNSGQEARAHRLA